MITTFQQHIEQQKQELSHIPEDFSRLLSGITLASKIIEAKIRSGGLTGIAEFVGNTNVQGEIQQKLDVYANEAMLDCLSGRASVAALISEENDAPITFDRSAHESAYIIAFDPLDGSSNIDVNVNVGTILSIYKREEQLLTSTSEIVLQRGRFQVAAGTFFMVPPQCSCTRRDEASMDLLSIRLLVRLC